MSKQMPPWLQEQLKQFQQTQVDLQNVMLRIDTNERDMLETERAIKVLEDTSASANVYKATGPVMIQTDKSSLIDELTEKLEMSKTAATVLTKQKERLTKALQEYEAKLAEATRGGVMNPRGS